MADDGKPTFGEIRDAMMPPGMSGTDRERLWSALKGAHQTGGHVPGRPAPDISGTPSPQLLDALKGAPARTLPCMQCLIHHAPGTPCAPLPGQSAASMLPADPFSTSHAPAVAIAEMWRELQEAGIPVESVDRQIGTMLAVFGYLDKDGK